MQLGDVLLQDIPYYVVVDTEVVMNEHIAHACDVRPVHMRVLAPQVGREFFTATPITSKLRTMALLVVGSSSKVARSRPAESRTR